MNAQAKAKRGKRAVHRLLAQLVKTDGTEAPRRLFERYRDLNREHFQNKLGQPFIMVTATSSPRALADYCGQDEQGIESRIRIKPSVVSKGDAWTDDVLLHEMVHAWMAEQEHDTEDGYKGHGPGFAEKCNHIGERLNLSPVFARGRGGPDCAKWPMCVRPPGFYGEPAPAPETKPDDDQADDEPQATPEQGPTLAQKLARVIEEHAATQRTTVDEIRATLAGILEALKDT